MFVTRNYNNRILPYFLAFVIYFFITIDINSLHGLSISNNEVYSSLGKIFSEENNAKNFMILLALVLFARDLIRPVKKAFIFILLFVGSIVFLVCEQIANYGSLSHLITYKIEFFALMVKSLSVAYILYGFLYKIIYLTKDYNFNFYRSNISSFRFYVIYFIVLSILWSPYLLAYFPGTTVFDGLAQIAVGAKWIYPNDHHPWISSFLFYKVFNLFPEDKISNKIFSVTLFIYILYGLTFSAIGLFCKKIYNLKYKDSNIIWMPLIVFGITPIYGAYSKTILKDSPYSALLCLFFIAFCYCIINKEKLVSKKYTIFLLLIGFLCMCFRHNAFYILAPTLAATCIVFLFKRIKINLPLSLLIALIFIQLFYKGFFLSYYGILKGSTVEMLALPSQTIAYILTKEKDHLTATDKENANTLFLSIENIRANYNNEIFDPIKPYIKLPYNLKSAKSSIAICLNHKSSCIEGFIKQTYLYIYPYKLTSVMPVIFNNSNTFEEVSNVISKFESPGKSKYLFSDEYRSMLENWISTWINFQPLSVWMLGAYATWIAFGFLLIVLYTKKVCELLPLTFIPILTIILNMLSPVNGDNRYSLPCIYGNSNYIYCYFINKELR